MDDPQYGGVAGSEASPNSGVVPPRPVAPLPTAPTPRRRGGWRVLGWLFLALSVLVNIGLFVTLLGTVAFFSLGSQSGTFTESVIQKGSRSKKIVVVNVEGVINSRQADRVRGQLKMAAKDSAVAGLIIRVNSPGGTISASDQIYHEIRTFREREGKPVLAFMQGVAASGGYYVSAACEQIMAEPTAITGSIGVIMSYFVLEDLLEEKLGVLPVVVKSGERKDWPSSYHKPTEEQLEYLQTQLIRPAYARFLSIVQTSRQDHLSAEQVEALADGTIFSAHEAQENRLIDQIGYLDDAMTLIQSMADVTNALVVEYREPFTVRDLVGLRSRPSFLKIDQHTLHEWSTPQVLYLWRAF